VSTRDNVEVFSSKHMKNNYPPRSRDCNRAIDFSICVNRLMENLNFGVHHASIINQGNDFHGRFRNLFSNFGATNSISLLHVPTHSTTRWNEGLPNRLCPWFIDTRNKILGSTVPTWTVREASERKSSSSQKYIARKIDPWHKKDRSSICLYLSSEKSDISLLE
jgi:hypothetical protein